MGQEEKEPAEPKRAYNAELGLDWIQKHWKKSPNCTICDANYWKVSDQITELRPFNRDVFVIGPARVVPVIYLVCKVCGYTIFFNAVIAGLVEGTGPDEPGGKTGSDEPAQ